MNIADAEKLRALLDVEKAAMAANIDRYISNREETLNVHGWSTVTRAEMVALGIEKDSIPRCLTAWMFYEQFSDITDTLDVETFAPFIEQLRAYRPALFEQANTGVLSDEWEIYCWIGETFCDASPRELFAWYLKMHANLMSITTFASRRDADLFPAPVVQFPRQRASDYDDDVPF